MLEREEKYINAVNLLEEKKYKESSKKFTELESYRDSEKQVNNIKTVSENPKRDLLLISLQSPIAT